MSERIGENHEQDGDDRLIALGILLRAEDQLSRLHDYERCRPLAPIVHMMQSALDSLRVSIKCHYESGYNPFAAEPGRRKL